jgi:hypothetical protein
MNTIMPMFVKNINILSIIQIIFYCIWTKK